mmetsp:Transcript_10961/g.46806  ORF Transcript_10961/g.46806 Transcript_10961/m.46806 type:complete len:298 (-) Transcript_10961:961-1854(-)
MPCFQNDGQSRTCRRSASRASFPFFSDSSRLRRTGAHSRRWCVSSFRISMRWPGVKPAQPPFEVSPEARLRYRSACRVRAFVEPRTEHKAPDASANRRVPSSARRTYRDGAGGASDAPSDSFPPLFSRSHAGQNHASSGTALNGGDRHRAWYSPSHRSQRSTTPPPTASPPQHRHPSSQAALGNAPAFGPNNVYTLPRITTTSSSSFCASFASSFAFSIVLSSAIGTESVSGAPLLRAFSSFSRTTRGAFFGASAACNSSPHSAASSCRNASSGCVLGSVRACTSYTPAAARASMVS